MVDTPILPLRLKRAQVTRRGKSLIGPVDLDIHADGTTIVLGPNGAGKTSLLRLMHGMERLSSGSLQWAVGATDARKAQAFVFQRPIMMRRSVLDSLAYPLIIHGMARAEARAHAADWLEKVGLQAVGAKQATVLSGGEGQKLALARALIRKPQVLFLDEPCANLDGRAMREIETILMETRAQGTRILMATHDMGQAKRLANDVLFVCHGRIVESAPASTFFTTPETSEARAFLRGDIVE